MHRTTFTSDCYAFGWHVLCRFGGTDARGGEAVPVTIMVQLCNCSQRGECVWDQVQDGFNRSDIFYVVSCDCEPFYEGRDEVLFAFVRSVTSDRM